jgi:hypothetical protein
MNEDDDVVVGGYRFVVVEAVGIKPRISACSCTALLVGEQNYLLTLRMTMSGDGGDDVLNILM